jgi:hypothetical protein
MGAPSRRIQACAASSRAFMKDDARVDNELRGFLDYAYQLKEIADRRRADLSSA